MSLLLVFFFGLATAALDLAFRTTSERAFDDLLRSQVLGLLSAADSGDDGGIELPISLPEARYSNPGSGLYGQVSNGAGEVVWRSPSAVGVTLAPDPAVGPGQQGVVIRDMEDGTEVRQMSFGIEWEFDDGTIEAYVITVAKSLESYRAQISRFRRQLGGGFLLLAVVLLVTQVFMLRFLLKPLRRAGHEVQEIEARRRDRLSDGYPAELEGLARNLNDLVDSERARTRRYRESLDNLAHSLKTPLAVIRSLIDGGESAEARRGMQDQVQRMHAIVDYQLRRAAAGGDMHLGAERIAVAPTAQACVEALTKVYADRGVTCEHEVDTQARFLGDRGDLAELLGNLLDNAWKWAKSRVHLQVAVEDRKLWITVDDDGPGIPAEKRKDLMRRGERGDESVPGQGIGLAVVREILAARGGKLEIGDAPAGGARVRAVLPAA